MKFLKQIASYFWDIPIEVTSSTQNPYLEVVWSMGKKMLNTKEANFSFGNGYKVFQYAISKISTKIENAERILILGFGCGSIQHILENEYHYSNQLFGVEYDNEIIKLYNTHFKQDFSLNPILVCDDAQRFIANSTNTFDVIFIDLFAELNNVPFVFDPDFIKHLIRISPEGTLVFNTIGRNNQDKSNISSLLITLSSHFKDVKKYSFQELNQIIVAK